MLGTKIKQIRKENNLTQDDFGKKLLHTKSTISKWENNQAIPDIGTLKKISDLFEIDLNFLIEDINSKQKPKSKQTKLLFKWDKVNYSGNANIVKKNHKVLLHISWIGLGIIGLIIIFAPIFNSQDGVGEKEVIFMFVGMAIFFADTFWAMIVVRLRRRKLLENRWNVKFELFEDKIKIISVASNGVKLIKGDNITSIETIGQNNNVEIKIILDNYQELKLFGVDQSVYNNLINFKKGGSSE